jgi:hypothetical protein
MGDLAIIIGMIAGCVTIIGGIRQFIIWLNVRSGQPPYRITPSPYITELNRIIREFLKAIITIVGIIIVVICLFFLVKFAISLDSHASYTPPSPPPYCCPCSCP